MAGSIVFLVPGFFGFTSLGGVHYFRGVAEVLQDELARRGHPARVVPVATQPTGSIRRRADRLLQDVLDAGGLHADTLHFVGHSTGGLDVRLLLTPGLRLRDDRTEAEIVRRTRTAITVSTPHHGTPVANFFLTTQGQRVLESIAIVATSREGRGALWAAAKALSLLASVDDFVGRTDTFLDVLADTVLRRVTLDRSDPVWTFLDGVKADQGVILQLTPEAMDLFDAAVPDHPGVRYGCVVTAAPPPLRAFSPRDLRTPDRAILAALFVALHTLAGRERRSYPCPVPSPAIQAHLRAWLPFDVGPRSSDGLAPVYSQLHGRLLEAVQADHLDVVGQYGEDPDRALQDWLPSGSRFDRERFEAVWRTVGAALAGGRAAAATGTGGARKARAATRGPRSTG